MFSFAAFIKISWLTIGEKLREIGNYVTKYEVYETPFAL